MNHLSLIDSNLARRLEATDVDNRRDIAQAVAFTAVEHVNLDDPRIVAAIDALRAGQVGDTQERTTLEALVEELDNSALDAHDRLDEGTGSEAEYDREFSRARAATALWSAFEEDATTAASDSIYEAYHAVGEEADVIRNVFGDRV